MTITVIRGEIAHNLTLENYVGEPEAIIIHLEPGADGPSQGIQLEVLRTMNIRAGPGIYYTDLGDLQVGEVIGINDIAGMEVWIEFEPGKWAAMTYRGVTYLQKKAG